MILPCLPDRTTRRRADAQGGWTLVELLVVVVIVGILASAGIGYYQDHLLSANINQAVPYLQAIAAKNRIHFNRTGYFLATSYEEEIQKKLGVDLSDAGDFCFMIFCNATEETTNKCGNYGATFSNSSPDASSLGIFISDPGSQKTLFQVIAVLRKKASIGTTTGTVAGAGAICTPSYANAPLKMEPSGWVRDAGGKGGEGRVVVLSYPPPSDGADTATTIAGHAVSLQWHKGVATTDALTN